MIDIKRPRTFDQVFEFGGSSRIGEPSDAIQKIRKDLGASFRKYEPGWEQNYKNALDDLSKKHARRKGESEELYRERLQSKLFDRKPDFIKQIEKRVRLAAFLIGHPNNKLFDEEILPKLDYWDHRTERFVDIICVGFSSKNDEHPDGRAFAQMVRVLSDQFNYTYSGETDLVLFDVKYRASDGEAILEMGQAVSIVIERAIEEKAITSLSAFVEKLVCIGRKHKDRRPTWALSDHYGAEFVSSSLRQILLSLIPKVLRKEAIKGTHFYIKNLNKKK